MAAKKLTVLQRTLDKGATDARKMVEQIRQERSALLEELEWLESSPLPEDEALARIHTYIDDQAARFDAVGAIGAALPADRDADLYLAPLFEAAGRLDGYATGGVVSGSTKITYSPLICWLHGDALKAKIAETLEAMGYQAGPPMVEREQLIQEASQKIEALEIEEEQLIESAEEIGIEILRRPDCDPAIVLGLEIIEEEVPDKPAPKRTDQQPAAKTGNESEFMKEAMP